MNRPTIRDVAETAGVSVATVNRVLAGAANVREGTREHVLKAAENLGFYGSAAIRDRNLASRPKVKLGFLLLQPNRQFYQLVAQALREATVNATSAVVDARIEHLEDLSPEYVAERMRAMVADCDAICVTAAVHPQIMQAVDEVQARGVPVFALISQLSASGANHYVGMDNWKAGRVAGWAISKIAKTSGRVGILMGHHRYRNQEMNEAGFRSYLREFAPEFSLLEPLSTLESASQAAEKTRRLLDDYADLRGLFVAGGGVSGVIETLRASGRAHEIVTVGFELMDATRVALLDGTMTMLLSHPLPQLAEKVVTGMIQAVTGASKSAPVTQIVPFDIHTRENI